jgi:hypothetical protein
MRYAIAVACFCVLVSTGWAQEVGEDTTEVGKQIQETGEGGDEPQEQREETQEDERERLREKLRERLGDVDEEEPEQKSEEPSRKVPRRTFEEGKRDGEDRAQEDSKIVLLGGAGGCCFGPAVYVGYLFVKTEPPYSEMKYIKDRNPRYQAGFREGYGARRRSRYLKAATRGCIIQGAGVVLCCALMISVVLSW